MNLKPLAPEEAIKFFKDKVKLKASDFYSLYYEARTLAFTVSGIAKYDQLETIYNAILKALKEGTTLEEFKKDIADIIKQKGWTGKAAWRVENIFRTNIQTAYNVGRYKAMAENVKNQPYWMYDAVNDSRTRPTHLALDEKVFPADSPFWDKWYPPNGFNCYDKETEVYTNKGWKKFSELNGDELFLSLNPENKNIEFVKPKKFIKYLYSGELIHIKALNFDLMVTPDHNLLVQKSWDRHEKKDKLKFIPAKDIADSDRFYRGCKWIGKEPEFIQIGDFKCKSELFMKFFGIWLAEGSCSINPKNRFVIKITQNNQNIKNFLAKELKDFPQKLWIGKDCIYIKPQNELGKFLKDLGKSSQKYIPDFIKNLSSRLLKILLNFYLLGDGYIQPRHETLSGNIANGSKIIFTSSKKLADDLSEIALKAGFIPSIRVEKRKGNLHRFKTGYYRLNTDIYTIILGKYKFFNFRKKKQLKKVKYNDYVYCVELEKFHTLWVKRNGKTVWCGNCRCSVIPLSKEQVKRKGLKIETEDPTGSLIEPIDPATGNPMPAVHLNPDPYFDTNPGKNRYGNLVKYYLNKAQKFGKFVPLPGMKDFNDYNLPPAKNLPSKDNTSKRLPSYESLENELSKDEISLFYKEQLISTVGGENVLINDPLGDNVIVSTEILKHLNLKSGSTRYITYIKDIIQNPNEIWLTPLKHETSERITLRKRFIYILEDDKQKKPLLLVLEVQNGIFTSWTLHRERSLSRIDKQRYGILLFPKK